MTDPDAPTAKLPPVPKRPPRERVRKPGPLGVIAGSFGLFFAITALLAFQMRRGADPALGAPKPQVVAQATAAPRQIVVRRVIVTRIVEHRAPRGSAAAAAAPAGGGTSGGGAPSGGSAPAPAAPAPAALAPAAPAPAPLTTRSS